MANVMLNEEHLVNIADAIREKNGSEDSYTPGAMADAIRDIPQEGGGEVDTGFKTARVETYGDVDGGFALFDKDENMKTYWVGSATNELVDTLINEEDGSTAYTIVVDGDYMTSITDNSTGNVIDLMIGTEDEGWVYSSNPKTAYQNGLVSGLVAYTIGGGSSSAGGEDLPAAEEVEF